MSIEPLEKTESNPELDDSGSVYDVYYKMRLSALGGHVVQSANHAADGLPTILKLAHQRLGTPYYSRADARRIEWDTVIEDELEEVRQVLSNLSEDNMTTALEVLKKHPVSRWLAEQLPALRPDIDLPDDNDTEESPAIALFTSISKRQEDGTYVIPDATLLNFLQWHNHAFAQESTAFNERLPEYKKDFRDRFTALVEGGNLPKHALARLDLIDDVDIRLDDGFKTSFQPERSIAGSYNDLFKRIIVSGISLPRQHDVINHELIHRIAKGTRRQDGIRLGEAGMYALFGNDEGGRILDEAVTTELAHLITYGRNPSLEENVYQQERRILHTLINNARGKDLTLFDFFYEYFDDPSNPPESYDGHQANRPNLRQLLSAAFPDTDIVKSIVNIKKAPSA